MTDRSATEAPPEEASEGLGAATMRELAGVLAEEAEGLDWGVVDRFVDVLCGARRILLFGAGRSGALALGFAQRLTHVGSAVAVVGESCNSRCTESDVVVVVSGSGATPSALTIADQARRAPCGHLCLVTTSPESPIGARCDLTVTLHGRSKGHEDLSTLAPYTAQFDLGVLALSECVARLIMARRSITDADIEQWRPNVE